MFQNLLFGLATLTGVFGWPMTPTFMNSKAFDESVANLSSVNDTLPSKVQSTSNEDAVQLNNGGKYLRIMDGDGNYRKVFVPSALTNFTLESTKSFFFAFFFQIPVVK